MPANTRSPFHQVPRHLEEGHCHPLQTPPRHHPSPHPPPPQHRPRRPQSSPRVYASNAAVDIPMKFSNKPIHFTKSITSQYEVHTAKTIDIH